MVGVPHSKGCINCRARRKGCDARQPSCSQCLQRGVKCEGYARDLKIVLVHPRTKKQAAGTVKIPPTSSKPTAAWNTSSSAPLVELLSSLLTTAYRSQTYDRFVTDYTPHSVGSWPRLPTNLAVIPSTSWIHVAVAVAPTDPVLNSAITALALAQVGRTTKQPDLLLGSQRMYMEALGSLNRRLKGGNERLSDATLAAASALSIYEMQEGSGDGVGRSKSWRSHVRGASALIQLRGKTNFLTPLSNRVFLGVQIGELIAAIGSRKRATNASLWSDTYRGSAPDSSLVPAMKLFEILHDLPHIMKEVEGIESTTYTADMLADAPMYRLRSLIERCRAFETSLTAWFDDLESRHCGDDGLRKRHTGSSSPNSDSDDTFTLPSELYWFEPSTLFFQLPYDSPRRIFPFFICFVDPDVAFQIILHWAGLLLMHRTLHVARSHIRSHSEPDTHIPNLKSPTDARSLALLIVQSLEYFVHPEMGLMGTNLIGFPLSVAQGFFEHAGTEEVLWFEVIFQRISELKSGLSGFLEDMAKRKTVNLSGYLCKGAARDVD